MDEKQMELFEDGGLKDEGGMVDEVSGNDVPVGSTREEVRDDIPAMLSEGEFVFPADVVRYYGLERLMEMRQEAKMGLKKMDAMGQMGNSDEATIPDDIPFSVDDLIIVEPREYAPGGYVAPTQTTYTVPSGFENTQLTPPTIPDSSVIPTAQTVQQGTPTGYVPMFVDQTTTDTTETTIPTTDTSEEETPFVPEVGDVYQFRKYKNASTGEIRDFAFYQGEPVIPIPDGFVPYDPETDTTATEDVTVQEVLGQTFRDDGGDNDPVFNAPTPSGPAISEMNAEELIEAARGVRTMQTIGSAAGLVINPVFGLVMSGAAALQRKAINDRAAELGIESPLNEGFFAGVSDIVDSVRNIFNATESAAAPAASPVTSSNRPTATPAEVSRGPSTQAERLAAAAAAQAAQRERERLEAQARAREEQAARERAQAQAAARAQQAALERAQAEADARRRQRDSDRDDSPSYSYSPPSRDQARASVAEQQSRSPGGGGLTGGANLDTAYGISGLNKGGLASKKRKPTKVKPNTNRGVAARKKK